MLSAEELEAALREIGEERYHWNHPFHISMKTGRLTKPQVQAWALNRYYYQSRIPIKDAAILARMDDAELRRAWRQRIIDHDGERAGEGGIERWLKLTDGLGLDRAYVISTEGVLPATRFAVDAYVHFVRERPLLERHDPPRLDPRRYLDHVVVLQARERPGVPHVDLVHVADVVGERANEPGSGLAVEGAAALL